MKRNVNLFFEDIKNSIAKVERYTKSMSFTSFKKDGKTLDAVVRNLEIIGEASKNIPSRIKVMSSDIPWKEIAGMRNKVVHEYFGVDTEILWKTIQEDLPALKRLIQELQSVLDRKA